MLLHCVCGSKLAADSSSGYQIRRKKGNHRSGRWSEMVDVMCVMWCGRLGRFWSVDQPAGCGYKKMVYFW